MRTGYKVLLGFFLALMAGWILLTLWVEQAGGKKRVELGSADNSAAHALIVYDPDPIYNLDEQVCLSFGKGLAEKNVRVTVATVEAARELNLDSVALFVFCANTYNWRPDWAITGFIKERGEWKGKKAIALTVGSGSTEEARLHFEALLQKKEFVLLDSRSLWLLRPNDETRMDEPNVEVANTNAYAWGKEIGAQLDSQNR